MLIYQTDRKLSGLNYIQYHQILQLYNYVCLQAQQNAQVCVFIVHIFSITVWVQLHILILLQLCSYLYQCSFGYYLSQLTFYKFSSINTLRPPQQLKDLCQLIQRTKLYMFHLRLLQKHYPSVLHLLIFYEHIYMYRHLQLHSYEIKAYIGISMQQYYPLGFEVHIFRHNYCTFAAVCNTKKHENLAASNQQ